MRIEVGETRFEVGGLRIEHFELNIEDGGLWIEDRHSKIEDLIIPLLYIFLFIFYRESRYFEDIVQV